MKILSTIAIGLLLFLGCVNNGEGQQISNDEINENAMEEFNIQKFNENKDAAGSYIFTLKDGTVVKQSGDQEIGYFEYSRKPKALFGIRKGFYPSGGLKIKGKMYHNSFEKGEWKVYGSNGKLDRTVDYDEGYDYSWEDLSEYCNDNNINLFHVNTRIGRHNEDGKPFWTIQYKIPPLNLLILSIDGKTGEIVEEKTVKLDKG
jgi:antitoxin component YwqK of YwqJK toxin-antitoxin module